MTRIVLTDTVSRQISSAPKDNPTRFPDSAGIPATTIRRCGAGTLERPAKPWKDLCGSKGAELAAIITEPIMANMGCILPREGYLQKLCELAHEYGALFILDEVVTGFRYAPGGCQELYGLKPDLSTFGKALGAGFPVGAVAGPRAILERMRWGTDGMVLHYGTFNGHRLTMKVIAANLDLLAVNEGAVYKTDLCYRRHRHRRTARGVSPPENSRRRPGIWTDVPDLFHETEQCDRAR